MDKCDCNNGCAECPNKMAKRLEKMNPQEVATDFAILLSVAALDPNKADLTAIKTACRIIMARYPLHTDKTTARKTILAILNNKATIVALANDGDTLRHDLAVLAEEVAAKITLLESEP